jgi:hypothetical protein
MPLVTYSKQSGKGRKYNSWRIPYGKYDKNLNDLKGGRRRLQPLQSVLIVGGMTNRIPDNVWEKIKDHPDVKARLESGELVILMKPQKSPEKPGDPIPNREPLKELKELENLEGYREAESIVIIENTMEVSTLTPWFEFETMKEKKRHKVITALDKQIKKVSEADRKLAEGK